MIKRIIPIFALFLFGCSSMATEDPGPIPSSTLPMEPSPSNTNAPEATETPEPTRTNTPEPEPQRYTTILMGTDWDPRRPERVRFGVRSDVFIIVTWLDHWRDGITQVDVISLPRDLWIQVPCSPLDPSLNGNDRVNAAYAYGRFDCVRETVEANFGFEVNVPMFVVQMLGFIEIVDLFEPLIVVPTQTYSDWCGDFQGTEGGHGATILWEEGIPYLMDGNYVLCYVRARANAPTGDLDRNRRALEVIDAMSVQYPNQIINDPLAAVPEILGFWGIIKDNVESDVTISDIFKFGSMFYDVLEADRRYIRLTLDEVDFWTTPIYGASVLLPKVNLFYWTECMQQLGPVHLSDGKLVCTETWEIDPYPASSEDD